MLLRAVDFEIFPLFIIFVLQVATFVCHWAAHIAVFVDINGPTKAEDDNDDDGDDDDASGLPFQWNLCSQARQIRQPIFNCNSSCRLALPSALSLAL